LNFDYNSVNVVLCESQNHYSYLSLSLIEWNIFLDQCSRIKT